jgi:hypothetical protein
MRPSLIIPRLREQCATLGGRVGGAADFAAAEEVDDLQVPCAFVVPGGDTVGPSEVIAEGFQEVEDRFTVIVCVSNSSDERGQQGMETLYDIRDELLAALLNWSPSAAHGRISYAGSDGDPLIDRARIWHGYDFTVATSVSV